MDHTTQQTALFSTRDDWRAVTVACPVCGPGTSEYHVSQAPAVGDTEPCASCDEPGPVVAVETVR